MTRVSWVLWSLEISIWLLLTPARRDTEVSCVFMESCMLLCSFQGGKDVVVHWNQMKAGDLLLHSYYHNQDQLAYQDQSFRGRTSLFKDQICRGNASLQLTGVKVQDQGQYKCFTSTIRGNQESFIDLEVDAPVVKVDLQQAGNNITCSSEGIYPEPELSWSTSPPSNVAFKNQTKVQETEQLLYNISGSLICSDTDLIYSCNISTRSNWRRATLLKPASQSLHTEATIPCSTSSTNFSGLTWRFNHSQIILTQTRADVPCTVSEQWRQQVKGVSESGSLILQDLSSHHEGTYTCELSDAEGTLITNTVLRTDESMKRLTGNHRRKRIGATVKKKKKRKKRNSSSAGLVIGLMVVALLLAAVGCWLAQWCKQKKGQRGMSSSDESQRVELDCMM